MFLSLNHPAAYLRQNHMSLVTELFLYLSNKWVYSATDVRQIKQLKYCHVQGYLSSAFVLLQQNYNIQQFH